SANSLANVSYGSVLQERTPDAFRGRVFAAFEFVTNVAFLTGAFLAGWLGSRLGVRASYVFSGSLFLCAAFVARGVLPRTRATSRAVLVGFERVLRRPAPRHAAMKPVAPVSPVAPVPAAAAT